MRAEVRDPVGTARTKVGLARLWHIQSLSKSATADFDERAFAHPTLTDRFGVTTAQKR